MLVQPSRFKYRSLSFILQTASTRLFFFFFHTWENPDTSKRTFPGGAESITRLHYRPFISPLTQRNRSTIMPQLGSAAFSSHTHQKKTSRSVWFLETNKIMHIPILPVFQICTWSLVPHLSTRGPRYTALPMQTSGSSPVSPTCHLISQLLPVWRHFPEGFQVVLFPHTRLPVWACSESICIYLPVFLSPKDILSLIKQWKRMNA